MNDIQQLCTGDAELVVGSIYGLRQWSVIEADNRFAGVKGGLYGHNGYAWNVDGHNEATCALAKLWVPHTTEHRDERMSRKEVIACVMSAMFSFYVWYFSMPVVVTIGVGGKSFTKTFGNRNLVASWIEEFFPRFGKRQVTLDFRVGSDVQNNHEIISPNCTCGFYAYTNEDYLRKNSVEMNYNVFGIVRAWGNVTIGSGGFRAQYAEIVGLTRLPEEGDTIPGDKFNRFDQNGNLVATYRGPDTVLSIPSEKGIIPTDLLRYEDVDHMLAEYERLINGSS